ncbi:MAG TPA: hypothetical protein PLJ12_00110, partial [Planctomycetota bacterium]|nr:hypothetical protein [Planctomycetota bacterium]
MGPIHSITAGPLERSWNAIVQSHQTVVIDTLGTVAWNTCAARGRSPKDQPKRHATASYPIAHMQASLHKALS